MNTLEDTLKQALEVLRMPCDRWNKTQTAKVNEAITSVLQAIAEESATQEPVGEAHQMQEGFTHCIWSDVAIPAGTKLYTRPKAEQEPKREPLTDEQIEAQKPDWFQADLKPETIFHRGIRAAEAAHNITGEA